MKPVARQARVTPGPPRTRLLRAGAIAFAAAVVSWLIMEAFNNALSMVDLTVYRDGGLIVWHVRPYYEPGSYAPLYDWGGFSPLALKFTYTPFAALAFAVVSKLPWGMLMASSVVVNMAALVAALWFTLGGLGYADRRARLGAALLAAAATFWLQPVVRTIYLGQINLILMAAIMWDLCQPGLRADGRRRWWKGALTGVAAGIKLVPLVFVPYLLITRRFREAAATLAGFAVTVGAGFAVLPHDSSRWWLHGMFLADGNRAGFMGWAGNQSLRAIITRFSGSVAAGQDPWIAAAVVALALGLTAAYLLDRAGYPVPALLATALAGLLASPVSWDHHWVWIAPAVAVTGHYALAAARHGARGTARSLWALAAAMLVVFAAWPDAMWESARNLGNFSFGILWAQPNTNPIEFAQHGDQPSYVEYHWHGFQLLWGNAYILAGTALLVVLLALAWRLAARPGGPGRPGTRGTQRHVPLSTTVRLRELADLSGTSASAPHGWKTVLVSFLWLTVFLDFPADRFDRGVEFWGQVTGYGLSPSRGANGEFATLLPPSGDAYLRVQRVRSGPGGCHLDLHVDTAAESLEAAADRARSAGAQVTRGHERLVVAQSPGGFPFCLVEWHGEQAVPPPLAGDGTGDGDGVSRVDTLCLDVPPGGFDRELAFWAALTGRGTRPAPVPGYAYLDGPAGWPARLLLQRREQAAPADPVSGHVDFGCTDPRALGRHVALGARVTATRQYWTVLTDPAGREYCLVGREPR